MTHQSSTCRFEQRPVTVTVLYINTKWSPNGRWPRSGPPLPRPTFAMPVASNILSAAIVAPLVCISHAVPFIATSSLQPNITEETDALSMSPLRVTMSLTTLRHAPITLAPAQRPSNLPSPASVNPLSDCRSERPVALISAEGVRVDRFHRHHSSGKLPATIAKISTSFVLHV